MVWELDWRKYVQINIYIYCRLFGVKVGVGTMTLMYGQYSEVGALTTFLLSGRHDFPNTLFGLKPLMPCCRCHHCPSHSTGYQFLGWRHGVATESFPVGGDAGNYAWSEMLHRLTVPLCRKFMKIHYSQKVNRFRKRAWHNWKKNIETIVKAEDNEDRIAGSPSLRDFCISRDICQGS